MRARASTRNILTTVSGRSGARIPTGVGGDAAAIGGGLMAIGIYDHPLNGPPEAVSEIAYDEQGNLVPMEAAMPGPPGASGNAATAARGDGAAATAPPTAMGPPPPPPPPPGPDPVAGAIVGGTVGGIIGGALGRGPGALAGAAVGATTGAVVAAEAQARPGGYYWWRGACYYRYPNGAWSPPMGPRYCGY